MATTGYNFIINTSIALIILLQGTKAAFDVLICAQIDGEPVVGVSVECKDDDIGTDDFIGTTTTGDDGCAAIHDVSGWDSWWNEDPDVYCNIDGDCFAPFRTVKINDHNPNHVVDFGTVDIPGNGDFCGVSYNGCGANFFPDWLGDATQAISGFNRECIDHDICYADCNIPRNQCDEVFYNGMKDSCGTFDVHCLALAKTYHWAVENFGKSACLDARDHCGGGNC